MNNVFKAYQRMNEARMVGDQFLEPMVVLLNERTTDQWTVNPDRNSLSSERAKIEFTADEGLVKSKSAVLHVPANWDDMDHFADDLANRAIKAGALPRIVKYTAQEQGEEGMRFFVKEWRGDRVEIVLFEDSPGSFPNSEVVSRADVELVNIAEASKLLSSLPR